ncbi:MAG: type II secretion system F family protein [Planctomycetota bacterium]
MLLIPLIASLAVFAAVFLTVYAVFRYPVPAEPPAHRRVARALGTDSDTLFENPLFAPPLNAAASFAGRINIPTLRKRIRQDLDASGNPSAYTVNQYLAICLITAVLTAIVGSLLAELLVGGILHLSLAVFAVLGFYVPLIVLKSTANKRVAAISKQLPYTLDLVALVMAAGSSFTEAVETLIRDDPDDQLNQELQLALAEIEFGSTRAQALDNLARRIPLETLRSVVGALNQADKLGTPLSKILKLQADMLRMHRSVHAEKLSASASLRILIPSMLILIAVVVAIFAPLVMGFLQSGSLF